LDGAAGAGLCRIAEAGTDDLEAWSLRILDAATIDKVLH
jgi:hypothetical protein